MDVRKSLPSVKVGGGCCNDNGLQRPRLVLAVPCQWRRSVSAGMPAGSTGMAVGSAGMPVEPTCVYVSVGTTRLCWPAGGADLCTRHGFGGQSGQSHASRDDPSLPACQQTRLRLCWHADRTDLCIRHSFVRGSPAGLLSQCVFRSRSDKICYL